MKILVIISLLLAGTKVLPFGENLGGVSATESRVIAEGILAQVSKEQIIRIPENPEQVGNAARKSNNNSIKSISETIELLISPNPAREKVSIDYKFSKDDSSKEIILADIVTGRIVVKKTIEEQKGITYIDASDLSGGLYMIHLKENNIIVKTAKVVIIQ